MRYLIAKQLDISPEDNREELDKAIEKAINELLIGEAHFSETESENETKSLKEVSSNPDTILKKNKGEVHLERLKAYVFKCGVRKVWKKELEGLTTSQSITKINRILEDLGMTGRPTLQKCKEIKERREYEKEMEVIDTSNIIGTKRRQQVQSKVESHESSFEFLYKLGDPDA